VVVVIVVVVVVVVFSDGDAVVRWLRALTPCRVWSLRSLHPASVALPRRRPLPNQKVRNTDTYLYIFTYAPVLITRLRKVPPLARRYIIQNVA